MGARAGGNELVMNINNKIWPLALDEFSGAYKTFSLVPQKSLQVKCVAIFVIVLFVVEFLACNEALAIREGSSSAVSWVVRVINVNNNKQTDGCTGAAVTAQIIVTAQHCKAHAVVFGGRTILLDSIHDVSGTQARLLVLSTPVALDEYAQLGEDFIANGFVRSGTMGAVYGYGPQLNGEQRKLNVSVSSHRDAEGEEIFTVASIGGALEHGDSGGPLIIDGHMVGVLLGAERGSNGNLATYDGLSRALKPIVSLDRYIHARAFMASDL